MIIRSVKDETYIDVQEADGRFVTWKEKDCYQASGDLYFTCRDGKIANVLVSYDGGRHYQDETDRYKIDRGRNRVVIQRKYAAKCPFSIRFMIKNHFHEQKTRNYRISFEEERIISEITDRDSSFDNENMIN